MPIQRINEFPEGSGSLSNDDVFLFMDDPSGSGITKKISLSQISNAIGGGGGGINFEITSVDLHNGGIQNAQVLKFDDSNYQSVITGPTPAENANAQRLIIQGQRGSGVYEGGDVYVWGGDSDVNGGDIKIYAGDADGSESGYGGYVNIDAGNGFNQGGNVAISAGNSSEQGGNVTITAGNSPIGSGTVYIRTGGGAKEWQFNNNGAVVFPNNSTVAVGTFDNNTGGSGGISLTCAVGYQLNWQGGHLKNVEIGDVIGDPRTIYCDSPIQFTSPSAITFSNTSLTDAIVTWKGQWVNTEGYLYVFGDVVYTLEYDVSIPSGIAAKLWVCTDAVTGSMPGTDSSWTPLSASANSIIVINSIFNTTLTTDASAGDIFDIALTNNATLANPTNPVDGKTIRWRISQDSTGNRVVTLGNKFNIPSSASSPLPWSISANKMDVLAATYHSGRDKWDIVAFVPGY